MTADELLKVVSDKDEALEFKPKLGSLKKKLFSGEGFRPFTVKKSTFPKEWLAANFPEALQEANQ
jgi:hypothetical protein